MKPFPIESDESLPQVSSTLAGFRRAKIAGYRRECSCCESSFHQSGFGYQLCRLDLGDEKKRMAFVEVYEKAGVIRYSSLPTHLVGFRELLKWAV